MGACAIYLLSFQYSASPRRSLLGTNPSPRLVVFRLAKKLAFGREGRHRRTARRTTHHIYEEPAETITRGSLIHGRTQGTQC